MAHETFDAIIIGSGAGGAPIAHELARAGKRVLVLEKGPRLRTQDDYTGPGGTPSPLSDFKRDELFGYGSERLITVPGVSNTGDPFYPSHVEPDLNDEPHLYSGSVQDTPRVTMEGYTAQVVGGGTQIYGGVSLRFSPDDFRLRSFNDAHGWDLADGQGPAVKEGTLDWPISYSELEPYYTKAERLIGLNGTRSGQAKPIHLGAGATDPYQTPLPPNPISQHALNGMQALGMTAYRTPLAVITEDHPPSGRRAGDPKTSYINRYGDPLGLKSNTWVALLRPILRDAVAAPFLTLRCNCHVTHLSSEGSRVTVVHYRDPSGRPRTASSRVVVVACSAIESVRLLLLSCEEDRIGFGARLKYGATDQLLGRYFLTHCFGGAEVAIPGGVAFDKSLSLDSDWATDFAATEAFVRANKLWAGGAIYNNTSDQALPVSLARTHGSTDLDTLWQGFAGESGLRGDAIRRWLDRDFGRRLSISFMANQVPWIENHIRLHPSITDKWGRRAAHVVKSWHPHDHRLMDVFAKLCEDILLAGVPGVSRDTIEEGSVKDQGVRIANHILGGARFGADPSQSVLDRNCRAWNFDNLYVTDGACMPTSGGANPTLTIQANAFRVADHLLTIL